MSTNNAINGPYSSTPNANFISQWDANKNMSANNFLPGYATTATGAGTTTLDVTSAYNQFFTGSSTQTVVLPVASTLVLGHVFYIVNNSSGVVTVQSSGGNTIQAMAATTSLLLTCILTSGTSAASWSAEYIGAGTPSGTSVIVDDTTTNATMYPTWVTANSGTLPIKVSSTKMSFNPSTGTFTLAESLQIGSSILDSNGNILLGILPIGSAVNYLQIFNDSTGLGVGFIAKGSDSAVPIQFETKNSDVWLIDNTATIAPALRFYNAAGSQYTALKVATAAATSLTLTLPSTDAIGAMQSDGSGNLLLAKVPLTNLATQSAATLLANITAGAAAPTAITAAQAITNFKFPNMKTITVTRDLTTGSGNVSYTGVGFQPRYIFFYGATTGAGNPVTISFYDGSSIAGMGSLGLTVQFVTTASWQIIAATTNAAYQTAVVNSLDSDGFTLGWTKVSTPTGTFQMFAVCIQ